MLHYILQTVAFQVFFLIIYDVFLRNETFFNWNRAYLIGTAFLSFILPFLKFDGIKAIVPEPMIIRLPEVVIGEVSPLVMDEAMMIPSEQISEQALSFSWTYVWVIGMVLAALILAYKIIKIMRMLYKNPKRWQGDALFVFLLNSSAAFSFFHYIFLGNNIQAEKKEHIVQHEMVHVKEKHSLDLLVFEVLRIVFWFNPLIYMYQNRLATLHEFIADAKAVKYKGKSEYYQSLLSEVFETQQISFINPFFHQSLIKKRIIMLSKSKSKQIHLIKYALLAPVVMVMLMYTSSYASAIKDPFPFIQNEVLNQELTFQELVEKYYKEILDLSAANDSYTDTFPKINEDYSKPYDNYIINKDDLAKRQAFRKYFVIKFKNKEKTDDETYKNMLNRFETYEEYLVYKKTDNAKRSWENDARDGELRLVVDNMGKLTDAEQKLKAQKMALIEKDDFYYKLKMTDGKLTTVRDFGKKDTQEKKEHFESGDIEVPFAVIDEVPKFKGCEDIKSNSESKQCTSDNVAQFVNKNFNTDLATELGLTGRQRISAIFKIGPDGKIKDILVRAPHPGLEAETIRVIKLIPDFTPGKQKGKAVTVPYSLPILFQVQDDILEADPKKILNSEKEWLKERKSKEQNEIASDGEIPYAVIDEVPFYPGCEKSGSKDQDRKCTSNKISEFVNKNFNTDLATELGLKGRQRISVIFKIGPDGKIKDIFARAPHPGLEAETIRVIKLLPDFTPGKQKGIAVTVPYSLPILFQVQDDVPVGDNSEEPFVALDEVFLFTDAQVKQSKQSDKQSPSFKISQFVSKNFNVKIAKELDLTGTQRVNVIFKIDGDGKVQNIQTRASHPDLETEAKRVINLMPDFILGKQKGSTVSYSLPIVLKMQ